MAEMEILRLNYELEYIKAIVTTLAELGETKTAEMDAGKWYPKKPYRPDIPNN